MIDDLVIGNSGGGSFYLINKGQFAIIDPGKTGAKYADLLKNNNATLSYVLFTSFNASNLDGLSWINSETKIIAGPDSDFFNPVRVADDEEEFPFGDYIIKLLHTPGKYSNSSCILVSDKDRKPLHLFTGAFLEEKQGSVNRTLAPAFFESLRMKIMSLPDEVLVYPSSQEIEKLKVIREKSIYLDHKLNRDQFIKMLEAKDILYSASDSDPIVSGKKIHSYLSGMKLGMNPMDPGLFRKTAIETGALILDTRSAEEYMKMHIPGTLYIGLDDSFAPLAGALLPDPYIRILFVADEGREKDVIIRLARMGFDFAIGFLKGGVEAWKKAGFPTESFPAISPSDFAELRNNEQLNVLDVRKKSDYEPGHLLDATHLPLEDLQENTSKISLKDPVYIYCVSGYRSVIACSILQLMGRKNVINVSNGFEAVVSSGLKKELIDKSAGSIY